MRAMYWATIAGILIIGGSIAYQFDLNKLRWYFVIIVGFLIMVYTLFTVDAPYISIRDRGDNK